VTLDEEDVWSIIAGIFDANRRLQRIAVDVNAIRRELLEEDDNGEEQEGDH
jgi:hypothetical protein